MTYTGRIRAGAGNASDYHTRNGGEVQRALAAILGYTPHPGTANVSLNNPFDFRQPHLVGALPGADGPVRFYPVTLEFGHAGAAVHGHVMRLKRARMRATMVGVLSPVRLRDFGTALRVGHLPVEP